MAISISHSFHPKGWEHDTYTGYKIGNVDEATNQEHQEKKEKVRNQKEVDKKNEDVRVFTIELQSVLMSPKSNVSALCNKTKLIVHNYMDIQSLDGYCLL